MCNNYEAECQDKWLLYLMTVTEVNLGYAGCFAPQQCFKGMYCDTFTLCSNKIHLSSFLLRGTLLNPTAGSSEPTTCKARRFMSGL